MGDNSNFKISQIVELSDGRRATIRFVGTTHFSPGAWIGVELGDASGKNDGSVQGERYFHCDAAHGMFCRPAAIVSVLEEPVPLPPRKASLKVNGDVLESKRPLSGTSVAGRRTSALGGSARQSANGSASPISAAKTSAGLSRDLRSPTKSPTKHVGSSASSGASTPRTTTPGAAGRPPVMHNRARPSLSNRTSMGPPAAPTLSHRPSRQSMSGPPASRSAGTAVPPTTRPSSNRLSLRPGQGLSARRPTTTSGVSPPSEGSEQETIEDKRSALTKSPPKSETPESMARKSASPVLTRTSALSGATNTGRLSSPVTSRSAPSITVASREVEDLKTKLRLMEKRRMEDREKLKSLERVQSERDKFEAIIQKLQQKYQPQQQEIAELRKQLKETDARIEEVETQHAEHEMALEMATLDREMAEESAEGYKTEMEAYKLKAEELELEVEILREENEELGKEMSPEEKTSQGWLQMERNNERLREALLRLRDMTQQSESELRDQIQSLEEDVREMSGVKDQYETTKEKLQQSDAVIDELRQQLETALGAEEMIEELTEKNMNQSEVIEDLRVTIEDLESLKELNDELEINHIETEKQMQQEIDYKDNLVAETARKAAQQEEMMEDYEYTVARFRELVTTLQSDLEDMKSSQQLTETEAEELASRSRAMMDLNMKLQVSAAKTQLKTIDLELRRLDAQEAAEHLAIVQLFLPEAYHAERDSVLALLRFKRVEFKSNLLHGFIKERVGGHTPIGHEDDIFAACDVLDKLTWVKTMCDRFVNTISECTIDQFSRFEGALYELEPVERALNSWIDGLRRDELKEKQCAEELSRTIALMSHLAEIHIPDTVASYAGDVHMRALLVQSNLESTASAISHSKSMILAKVPSTGEDDEEAQHLLQKMESVISHTRSAKVITTKVVRALDELKSRSLSLGVETLESFVQCGEAAEELAMYARTIGLDLFQFLSEEGRREPFTNSEVQTKMYQTTSSLFGVAETDLFATFNSKLRKLISSLLDLGSLTSDLEMTVEFERSPAPWLLRSQELKSTKTISVDVEDELRRLKEDVHERSTQIKICEKSLGESSVKIELLESRMRDATKKGERISELEKFVDDAKEREKDLKEAIAAQERQLRAAEIATERLKREASQKRISGEGSPGMDTGGTERAVATAREMEALQTEVMTLQSAVRYLREDNRRARLVETGRTPSWLEEPLMNPKSRKREKEQLLKTEGKDVLHELLYLAQNARLHKLEEGEDRNKWRPAKETARWKVERQRENWEVWKQWRGDVVARVKDVYGLRETVKKPKKQQELARFNVKLSGKGSHGMDIIIASPGAFEEFRDSVGIASI